MKIAVPKLHEIVAPCFESATFFLTVIYHENKIIESQILRGTGCEGYGRVRLLQDNKVNQLICNGIKVFYRDLLEASGITVIDNVSATISKVLAMVTSNRLPINTHEFDLTCLYSKIPHEDLVCWTKELFQSHGYDVHTGPGSPPFPIDLVAEIKCPICGEKLKIAICCGAHTYRIDQEIRELYYAASGNYQAKVYVQFTNEKIRKYCREYDIEVIDPDAEGVNTDMVTEDRIPILKNPVPGHELAFGYNSEDKNRR